MAVLNKRQKIVSFRVSEEEYENLRVASENHGAHSISDYARLAACRNMRISEPPDLRETINSLATRLDDLQREMQRMSRRVEEFR